MFRNLTVRARAVITCGATTAVTVFLVAEGVRRGADPGAMLAEGLTLVVLLSGLVRFFLAKPGRRLEAAGLDTTKFDRF